MENKTLIHLLEESPEEIVDKIRGKTADFIVVDEIYQSEDTPPKTILIIGPSGSSKRNRYFLTALDKILERNPGANVEFRDIEEISKRKAKDLSSEMKLIWADELFEQPKKPKRSQSNNPSERWIKPKKLRRTKGGRR